jgi:hypothetical protein
VCLIRWRTDSGGPPSRKTADTNKKEGRRRGRRVIIGAISEKYRIADSPVTLRLVKAARSINPRHLRLQRIREFTTGVLESFPRAYNINRKFQLRLVPFNQQNYAFIPATRRKTAEKKNGGREGGREGEREGGWRGGPNQLIRKQRKDRSERRRGKRTPPPPPLLLPPPNLGLAR